MALQPFNYFFFQSAGTITVNGVAPVSQYEEGTSLTIQATFTDGNTNVEWIVNNASQGTTNPLVINMPVDGIYLRILGSGAPEVTNQFRFFWRFGNGIGSFTVNGGVAQPYYEAGTSLTIETVLVPGFTFDDFNINNGFLVGVTNPYTFTMPSQDVDITVNSTGVPVYVDNHGLRYFSEFCDIQGNQIELQILEENYEGTSEKRICQNVRYNWGVFGSDILEPRVPSSVSFSLIGSRDEFFELLDGGYRYWKVRIYRNTVLFWEGYLSNQFLTVNEVGYQEAQRFTAVDGLKSLEAIRAIDSFFTRIASGFDMITTLSRAMNQTFDNAREISVGCEIYETRLDRNIGVFDQLLVPDNAVYEDGEQPIYATGGGAELNTSLYISEIIDRILTPFISRIFLWKNRFYVVSTPELNKPAYTLFDYDTFGDANGTTEVSSGTEISCKFTQGQRTAKPVYTEFTNILKLGVLDSTAQGGVIDYTFGNDDWILLGPTSPYPNRYQLKNFRYVNAIPSNQPSSYPTGTSPALVQFVGSGYCKIWGTTSTDGIADPNTSYIEIDTYRNKNPIQVAQGISNTLAFKIEFFVEGRSSSEPNPVNQFFGVMIRVGNSWLDWDGDQTFTWVGTETVMEFPMLNLYSWNVVNILPVVIPEDGIVTIIIYETINNGGTADRYTVGVRNMSVKIEQNEVFTKQDIRYKFITDETYSNVYPPIETFIGDVATDNSTSAIKLNIPQFNYPHSQLWSIDGVTELTLSEIMLQEVANLYGVRNPRLIATVLWDDIDPIEIEPYKNVIYDGAYWAVMAIDLDFQLNTWRIELHQLGLIES